MWGAVNGTQPEAVIDIRRPGTCIGTLERRDASAPWRRVSPKALAQSAQRLMGGTSIYLGSTDPHIMYPVRSFIRGVRFDETPSGYMPRGAMNQRSSALATPG